MRFGIFYEHQIPRPWGDDGEQRLMQDALEQIELADRVGLDSVWEVEHHFLEEYSHSSASGVFLGAASQRTKRIRLGLGILPLPPGYLHPARVAETAAMLDLVSGGRVELGTGETSSGREIVASERCVPGGFAVNPQVACVLPMMFARDEAQAIERGIDGAHFFGYSLAHYYVFGDHRPGRTNIYEEFLERRDEVGFARSIINADDGPLGVRVLQQGLGSLRGAIGSPQQGRAPCPRHEGAGGDQPNFL